EHVVLAGEARAAGVEGGAHDDGTMPRSGAVHAFFPAAGSGPSLRSPIAYAATPPPSISPPKKSTPPPPLDRARVDGHSGASPAPAPRQLMQPFDQSLKSPLQHEPAGFIAFGLGEPSVRVLEAVPTVLPARGRDIDGAYLVAIGDPPEDGEPPEDDDMHLV